ncbi:MAG: hypothetical protein LH654_02795, partial [Thermoleophilia bacterium]|nr:hypothetical protein [Thermoleophilia bacterium]
MRRATKRLAILPVVLVAALIVVGSVSASAPNLTAKFFDTFGWTKVYDGPKTAGKPGWTGRTGLQAVELRNRLYILGGRTPKPEFPNNPFGSTLWNDAWESRDLGASWDKLPTQPTGPNLWSERAYFQAVTKDGSMFVLGGQDFSVKPNPAFPTNCPPPPAPGAPAPPCPPFVPNSTFFNDVWRSTDGTNWKELKSDQPRWAGRAGLSAIEFKGWIYLLGGGKGDDVAIGGDGRVLFDDVWRSRDGKHWEQVTAN